MTDSDVVDPEILAMSGVIKALTPLGSDTDAKKRVLTWAFEKLGFEPLQQKPNNPMGSPERAKSDGSKREGTFNTVTSALGANSARKIIEAAAVYLTLYQGKDVFSREELIACAKEAKYWKAEYSNQMAVAISRMEEGKFLFEKSKNVYCIEPEALAEMEARLAK